MDAVARRRRSMPRVPWAGRDIRDRRETRDALQAIPLPGTPHGAALTRSSEGPVICRPRPMEAAALGPRSRFSDVRLSLRVRLPETTHSSWLISRLAEPFKARLRRQRSPGSRLTRTQSVTLTPAAGVQRRSSFQERLRKLERPFVRRRVPQPVCEESDDDLPDVAEEPRGSREECEVRLRGKARLVRQARTTCEACKAGVGKLDGSGAEADTEADADDSLNSGVVEARARRRPRVSYAAVTPTARSSRLLSADGANSAGGSEATSSDSGASSCGSSRSAGRPRTMSDLLQLYADSSPAPTGSRRTGSSEMLRDAGPETAGRKRRFSGAPGCGWGGGGLGSLVLLGANGRLTAKIRSKVMG